MEHRSELSSGKQGTTNNICYAFRKIQVNGNKFPYQLFGQFAHRRFSYSLSALEIVSVENDKWQTCDMLSLCRQSKSNVIERNLQLNRRRKKCVKHERQNGNFWIVFFFVHVKEGPLAISGFFSLKHVIFLTNTYKY